MGLDAVELVMDVEDRFGITITDAEATSIRTVGDLVELCRQRIVAIDATRCRSLPCFTTFGDITRRMVGIHAVTKPCASSEPAAVLDELRPIIAATLGVHKDKVVPTARFVEDLGMG